MLSLRIAAPLLFAALFVPLSAGAQSIEGLQVDEEGKVGVGTTSPLTALDIRGDFYLDEGGHAENRIRWDNNFDYHWIGYTNPSFDESDWYMTFTSHKNEGFVWRLPGGGGGGDGEVMTLTGSDSPRGKGLYVNGQVGIGTSSPKRALHVKDSDSWHPIVVEGKTSGENVAGVVIAPEGDMRRRVEFAGRTDSGFRIWSWGVGNVMVSNGEGDVGIGTSAPDSKLDVKGNVTADTVFATTASKSARRFKTAIEPVENATALVNQLRGGRYRWKDSGKPDLGFVAEEVEEVLPSLVTHTEDGTVKGLNYSHLTAVLAEALKEQTRRTDSLRHKIRGQRSRLDRQQNRLQRQKGRLERQENRLDRQQEQIQALRSALQQAGVETQNPSNSPSSANDD